MLTLCCAGPLPDVYLDWRCEAGWGSPQRPELAVGVGGHVLLVTVDPQQPESKKVDLSLSHPAGEPGI